MAETFGSNRGLTPSIGKGVKRRNIRYNFNEEIHEYDSGIKNTKKSYREKTLTRIKDLEFYLGSDWIDWSTSKVEITDKSSFGSQASVNSKVLRCSICKDVYQTNTIGYSDRNIGNAIIKDRMYNNIPLYRGECGLCNG